MKKRLYDYKAGEFREFEVVTATLVRLWKCTSCGDPFLWEHVPLGKKYRVVLGTETAGNFTCKKCGFSGSVAIIAAQQGDTGFYVAFPLEVLEFEKEVVA